MASSRRKRIDPKQMAQQWIVKQEDPPGFKVSQMGIKGRGIVTKVTRRKGDFLLVYKGEIISAEEGERREEDGGSGYRFFFKAPGRELCVDATEESGLLGRLVNHGGKRERNSVMKEVNGYLCLFCLRDVKPEEEILYDYGLKTLPWETKKFSKKRKTGENGDGTMETDVVDINVKNHDRSADNEDAEGNGPGDVDDTHELNGGNTELTEGGTVEDGAEMEVEEANNSRTVCKSETENEILVYIVNGPKVTEMPSDPEHTFTEVRTADIIEGSDKVEIETNEEMGDVEHPVDVYGDKPLVESNIPKGGENDDGTIETNIVGINVKNHDRSADNADAEGNRPGDVDDTHELNDGNTELAEGGTVEDGAEMEVEEADNSRTVCKSETENEILVYIVNGPKVTEMPSDSEHTFTELRTADIIEGSDKVEIETNEEMGKVEHPVDAYGDKPLVESNIPKGGENGDGTMETDVVDINVKNHDRSADNVDAEGNRPGDVDDTHDLNDGNTELAGGTVEDGAEMEVEEADNSRTVCKSETENEILVYIINDPKVTSDPEHTFIDVRTADIIEGSDKVEIETNEEIGKVEHPVDVYGDKPLVESNIPKGGENGDGTIETNVVGINVKNHDRSADNVDAEGNRPGDVDDTHELNDGNTELAEGGTVEDKVEETDNSSTMCISETENEILVYIINGPKVTEMPSDSEHTFTDVRTADIIEGSDKVEIETNEEMGNVEHPGDKPPVESNIPKGGKWGSVVVVKGGMEIGVYPMDTTVLAIGSAKTDDIIVQTAMKHEAFIEVNHLGKVFLVDSHTWAGKQLHDNDLFEVGGRALKWKAKTVCSGEMTQNYTSPKCSEQTYYAQKLGSVSNSSSNITQDYTMKGEGDEHLQNENMYVSGSESDESERVPIQGDEHLQNENMYVSGSESDESERVPIQLPNEPDSTTEKDEHEGKIALRVMTVRPKEDRRGKTDYSKQHACVFCEKLDFKIGRHLCSKQHMNEKEIAQLPPPKKKGSVSQLERERALDALRNEGDFLYNVNILKYGDKNGFGLIVAKRPEAGVHNSKDYLPCRYCLRFYIKTELWRHGKRCQFMPKIEDAIVSKGGEEEKETRRFIKECTLLLYGAGVPSKQITKKDEEDFHFHILSSLQEDSIGKGLKQDIGIVKYGRNEFERLGSRRANEVRYRMRLLERIKQEVLGKSNKKVNLASLLVPEKFDDFIQAVRIISGISDERSLNGVIMFEKPELAKKTGQILKKFGEMSEGEAVVERHREKRLDIADFLFLYSIKWSSKIGSLAHQTTNEKRFNKKQMLPVTEDLQKLQKYLDNEIGIESHVLATEPSKTKWRTFAFLLLTKITLFNFRRGNECAAMQLTKFQQRDDWRSGNQEIYQSLSTFEQGLAKRMDLVEVMGKQNKKVPVLLTPTTRAGMDQLINLRSRCSIDAENPYVFAKGSRTFITGNEALKHVLDKISDLQRPELLKFPTMRKYLATVVQVFGMKENDVQEVARHMGHELAVHRKFYRLQDDVIELAKISKLLLAVENGQAHHFKGMSLDDLDLKDFPEEETDPEEVEDHLSFTEEITIPETLGEVDKPTSTCMNSKPTSTCLSSKPTSACLSKPTSTCLSKPTITCLSKPTSTSLSSKPTSTCMNQPMGSAYIDYDSESDMEWEGQAEIKKKKQCTGEKKKWTLQEKAAMKPLVSNAVRMGKPPTKTDIQVLQKKNPVLASIPWLKIKHQAWAMTQSEMKKNKKVMKSLKM